MLNNNLIPAAEYSNGSDVVDHYKLQQPPVPNTDATYSLLLSEFEHEHDFFDRVQLIAVDHDTNVNIAVSPYGEILTYTEPSPPKSAITNELKNVKHLLSAIDGNYYEGYNGSYVTLNFGDELDVSNGAKLVMRADARDEKWSIHVQILNETESWETVATVIPRVYWATEIIDMSEHLPDDLKVRLYFTANHKVDFVGLDTTKQGEFEAKYVNLASATHSTHGDIKETLIHSDNIYAELLPGEQITLKFTLPQTTEDIRDFIIILEGHYFTITP